MPCAKSIGKLKLKGSSPRKMPFEWIMFPVNWHTSFSSEKGPATGPIVLNPSMSENYKIGESFRNGENKNFKKKGPKREKRGVAQVR